MLEAGVGRGREGIYLPNVEKMLVNGSLCLPNVPLTVLKMKTKPFYPLCSEGFSIPGKACSMYFKYLPSSKFSSVFSSLSS